MSFFWIVFEIFINGYEAAYSMSFPTLKLGLKKWVKKHYIIYYWFFLTIIFSLINFLTDFHLISMYAFLIPVIVYLFVFIKGSIWLRFLWFFLAYLIIISTDILVISVYTNINHVSQAMIFQENIYRLQIVLISKPITLFLWYLFMWNQFFQNISDNLKRFFLVINLFSFAICALILLLYPFSSKYFQFFLHWFPFFFLILNLGNLIYYKMLQDQYKHFSWDSFLTSAFAYLYKTPTEIKIQPGEQQWQTTLSYKNLISYYWNQLLHNQRLQQLVRKNTMLLIILTILCIGIVVLFSFLHPLTDRKEIYLLFFLATMLLLANLLHFIFLRRIETVYKKNQEQQAQQLKDFYQLDLLTTYENLRSFRQTLLQQIQSIWRTKKQKASSHWRKQLDYFTQINQQLQQLYFTGNDLIDLAIAVKQALAYQIWPYHAIRY